MRCSGLNGDRELELMACYEREGCPVDHVMWSAGCLFLLIIVVFWGFCVLQGEWGVIKCKSCCRVGI